MINNMTDIVAFADSRLRKEISKRSQYSMTSSLIVIQHPPEARTLHESKNARQ